MQGICSLTDVAWVAPAFPIRSKMVSAAVAEDTFTDAEGQTIQICALPSTRTYLKMSSV